ncbi:MAG: protease HtpX [Elusimicrobia bacterium RIFOXYA2_FULL_39_19]|nr:MAG: protease HtpX [Elusimicrobia bacterium RIFOXYA2_FULL_39_19]
MNSFRTFILMLVLIVLFVWVGQFLGGQTGMITAFFMALIMNFATYWFSDKIVLMMYRAKEVKQNEATNLYSLVANVSQQAQMPMPKIYMIESPAPNAFATGRSPAHSAVAFTSGILSLLDNRELSGVIAHELSHIKNRDTLISVMAASIAGAIFMLARMAQWAMMFGGMGSRDDNNRGGGMLALVLVIIAPIAAMVIQLAISRAREYVADESAAKISGDPLALANALRKLTEITKRVPMNSNPATAHLFIVNPLKAENLLSLFSTHPPINERIRRLESLTGLHV